MLGGAYSCDAISGVVDLHVAAEATSRRHLAGTMVWWCRDCKVLIAAGYKLALSTNAFVLDVSKIVRL